MWWLPILSLIVEIIKLLLSLRSEADATALKVEYAAAKEAYRRDGDKRPLETLRERLRERSRKY